MKSKSNQRFIPPLYIAQIFGALFLFWYAAGTPLLDSDTAWHLASGDLIRHSGVIIHPNTWSYTAPHAEWCNASWAWDVLISAIMQYTGAQGLFVFLCSWYAALGCFLTYSLLSRKKFHPQAIIATVAVVMLVFLNTQWARPQNITVSLLLLFHYLLHKTRTEKNSGRIFFIWMPLLMALWANLHGGFIIAFVMFGIYGLEALYTRQQTWFKNLFLSGCLCLPATLLNPWGWKLWLSIYQNYTSVMTPYIVEWGPYIFNSSSLADVFLIVLLLTSNFRERTLPPADKLACFMWVIMSLLTQRYFPVAALLSAPMLAAGISLWTTKKTPRNTLPQTYAPKAAAIVAAGWLAIVCLPLHAWRGENILYDKATVPVKEIAFIHEHYPNLPFYNLYGWGGYIIYFTHGQTPVFVDGRSCTAYPENVLSQVVDIQTVGFSAIQKSVTEGKVRGVIYPNEYLEKHAGEIPTNWKLVFKGPVGSVYIVNR